MREQKRKQTHPSDWKGSGQEHRWSPVPSSSISTYPSHPVLYSEGPTLCPRIPPHTHLGLPSGTALSLNSRSKERSGQAVVMDSGLTGQGIPGPGGLGVGRHTPLILQMPHPSPLKLRPRSEQPHIQHAPNSSREPFPGGISLNPHSVLKAKKLKHSKVEESVQG